MSEKKYSKKYLDDLFEGKIKRLKGQPSYVRDHVRVVLSETAKEYNLTHPIELFTNTREMTYVKPRRVALTLVRDLVGLPFTGIASLFGFKDHTAPLHAYKLVRAEMEAGPALCRTVRNILECVDKIQAEVEEDQSSSL